MNIHLRNFLHFTTSITNSKNKDQWPQLSHYSYVISSNVQLLGDKLYRIKTWDWHTHSTFRLIRRCPFVTVNSVWNPLPPLLYTDLSLPSVQSVQYSRSYKTKSVGWYHTTKSDYFISLKITYAAYKINNTHLDHSESKWMFYFGWIVQDGVYILTI